LATAAAIISSVSLTADKALPAYQALHEIDRATVSISMTGDVFPRCSTRAR
jgi:hypothetical protein